MQSKIHVATTPGTTGSTLALLHLESQADVYGWFLASSGPQFFSSFFMLENFYAARQAVLYCSLQDDVYGHWIRDQPPASGHTRCPLPEDAMHELERLKSKLLSDWLHFADEPLTAPDRALYEQHGMLSRAVNVKAQRLQRLIREPAAW